MRFQHHISVVFERHVRQRMERNGQTYPRTYNYSQDGHSQLTAKKSAEYRLNWSSIPMATTHWLKNGPVALVWSVRMALLEPKRLARIGKQHPKTLRNKETALLKEKLNTVRKCSMISIPITQKHDLTRKRKTCTEKIE